MCGYGDCEYNKYINTQVYLTEKRGSGPGIHERYWISELSFERLKFERHLPMKLLHVWLALLKGHPRMQKFRRHVTFKFHRPVPSRYSKLIPLVIYPIPLFQMFIPLLQMLIPLL